MTKRGKNPSKLQEAASFLLRGEILPEKYKDHKLQGNFEGCRECHLEPDWLLIYRTLKTEILFERTGTHSDLFKK
ncbi:MAG: type II toxin-antitoxin system YafQ family toxin [Rickettsiales bacterium]|nr:type II toxin-antitoxin system YafQ family toxin [Rickettsiales bacterium]